MLNIRVFGAVSAFLVLSFVGAVTIADIVSGTSSVGSSSDITITQLSIAKPEVVEEGDVLLAGIAIEDGPSAEVVAPEGWTLIERANNESDVSILSYWKVASASESDSYLWEITPQTRAVGGITRYSGVNTSDPIDVVGGASGASKTAIAPSVTTVDGAEIVTLFAFPAGVTTGNHFSTPEGMTEKYDTAKSPGGPSLASHDTLQTEAGASGDKSSSLGSKRNWVAQTIALNPVPAVVATADDFNSYGDGDLNGLNGGTGWTGVWSGASDFDVQGAVTFEGAKAVAINVPGGQEPSIARTFAPKTSGVLHWVQRKDAPDHGSSIQFYSGATRAIYLGIGSATQPQLGGPDWTGPDGNGQFVIFQPYTVGLFDAVDLEFNTVTDMYRVSIDGNPYSTWRSFENPVDVIDKLELKIGASGNDVGPNYWDDIRFNN